MQSDPWGFPLGPTARQKENLGGISAPVARVPPRLPEVQRPMTSSHRGAIAWQECVGCRVIGPECPMPISAALASRVSCLPRMGCNPANCDLVVPSRDRTITTLDRPPAGLLHCPSPTGLSEAARQGKHPEELSWPVLPQNPDSVAIFSAHIGGRAVAALLSRSCGASAACQSLFSQVRSLPGKVSRRPRTHGSDR
jgi:hypothetical protein